MAVKGKRIGYVDFKLENFHANVYLSAFRKDLKDQGYEVTACTALHEAEGRAWAEKNGVPYFTDMQAMDQAVDFYAVLAPSNPEVHLELCRKAFPFHKPTYVDKTFAPDLKTAREIFALADSCGTAIQTTSALRYTNVQAHVKAAGGTAAVRHMVAWGAGRSFDEYGIHPTELVMSCMGPGVQTLMRRGTGDQSQLLLNFTDGRTAVINVYTNTDTPFAASVTTAKDTKLITVDGSRLFIDMAIGMLDFFATGKPNIDRQESLAIRAVLDTALNPDATKAFVPVNA